MKPSMSPRFQAATCASSTARIAAIALASPFSAFGCGFPYELNETIPVNERAMVKSNRRFIYSDFPFGLGWSRSGNILAHSFSFNLLNSRPWVDAFFKAFTVEHNKVDKI